VKSTAWDCSEQGPGVVDVLLQSTGVPIDHYSYEAVELLKGISARWDTARLVRDLAGCDVNKDALVCAAVRVPQARIYAIDMSDSGAKLVDAAADGPTAPAPSTPPKARAAELR
jgi:NTE family protein